MSESIYGCTLPLDAVVNSDGAAIYMGATVVFVANILGLDLSITQSVGVVITGVLVSLGTAEVPSGGYQDGSRDRARPPRRCYSTYPGVSDGFAVGP